MAGQQRKARRSWYPFNAEQTVNILGEFGPLMIMFVTNALYDIETGTWALIISSVLALVMMLVVLGRPPIFPFIAGAVTIGFGVMTLITGDAMWVQIKVTIFNTLFAIVLWVGLWMGKNFFEFIFGKTFHYSREGWTKFTNNFAWFFIFTAVANESVRLGFQNVAFDLFDKSFDGVQIWILFKVFVIMPLGGLFGWWQTRLLSRYKVAAIGHGQVAPISPEVVWTPTVDLGSGRRGAARTGAVRDAGVHHLHANGHANGYAPGHAAGTGASVSPHQNPGHPGAGIGGKHTTERLGSLAAPFTVPVRGR